MDLELDLTKSVDQNASHYYELAKKAKRKLEGAKKALTDNKRKLAQLEQEESKFWAEEEQKKAAKAAQRKKEWYEKFHWFRSSEGFLCIGGRDATSNEIIIKKHMEKDDFVFHTEMAGSPFFIVKDGLKAGSATLQEAAQCTAIYSRAWKLGVSMAEVFYVKPDQVTKEAKAGEFVAKGSFMIYGKKNFLPAKLECAIGILESGQVIGGPVPAIEAQTQKRVLVLPGEERKSDLAKKIKFLLKNADLDEIVKFLPGTGRIQKETGKEGRDIPGTNKKKI